MRYIISVAIASMAATAATAEVPRVVTDFAPAQGLVAMVMGDLGSPEMLLEQGANAHDFQLRPSQAAALADADLVVWMGPEMSPWLNRSLEGLDGGADLRLLAVEGTHLQPFGDSTAHDHAEHDDHADHADHDDHATEAADDHDGHDHDHDGMDPHAWLDPANGMHWLDAIAAELARLDPENAATYAANAASGKTRIAEADADLAQRLAPLHDRPFVVFHDAYGYFTAHYGLTLAGSVAAGDATSPGAAHLKELQEAAGSTALCLFPEAGHDPKLLAQMAEATGVKLGGALDPEGVTVAPDAGAYLAVLNGVADTLLACLAEG
jgi:zinc transport system substrate-binding protein